MNAKNSKQRRTIVSGDVPTTGDVLQLMRTLTTAQINKQLRQDKEHNRGRYESVVAFFEAAKEKPL